MAGANALGAAVCADIKLSTVWLLLGVEGAVGSHGRVELTIGVGKKIRHTH